MCVHLISVQTNKQRKKINPQCRDSTSLSCLALWFPSLYSASVAGVSGTLRAAPLSLMLPYLNLQTYLLLPRLRFCQHLLPPLTQSGSPPYRHLVRRRRRRKEHQLGHSGDTYAQINM